MPDDNEIRCALCGAITSALPVSWTMSVERGRTIHYCDQCSRANLRAIEAGLDSQWW